MSGELRNRVIYCSRSIFQTRFYEFAFLHCLRVDFSFIHVVHVVLKHWRTNSRRGESMATDEVYKFYNASFLQFHLFLLNS